MKIRPNPLRGLGMVWPGLRLGALSINPQYFLISLACPPALAVFSKCMKIMTEAMPFILVMRFLIAIVIYFGYYFFYQPTPQQRNFPLANIDLSRHIMRRI